MAEVPPTQYSEYPRPPVEPRIRLEAIGEAWKWFRADMGTWVLAAFLMFAVTFALFLPLYIVGFSSLLGKRNPDLSDILTMYAYVIPAMILAYAGQAIGFAGMFNMAIKQIQGQKISIRDMFHLGGMAIFSHIGAGVLIFLGVLIGSVLCYVPGFIIGGLLLFSQPIIVHQKLGAFAAMSQSWNLLKGQLWMATALYFIVSMVASLGAIACGIGILFTYPLYPLTVSIVYRDYLQALYGNEPVVAPA